MSHRILLVDDSAVFLKLTKDYLVGSGFLVDTAKSCEEVLALFQDPKNRYALVILDYLMEEKNGAEIAREILARQPAQYIVIYSNDPSRDALKNSWKSGAVEFIDKAAPLEEFLAIVQSWCGKFGETQATITSVEPSHFSQTLSSIGMVGASSSMARVAELTLKCRKEKGAVPILGETGTGKEKIARAIHGEARTPFKVVDCSAYNGDPTLLESELFGVEQGSFTGATKTKKGILEEVGRGTAFFDEVHTLSLKAQQKLLRVLQEKRCRPVGSSQDFPVHFRLIVAAKPELESMVRAGKFLPDLYYRLNVLTIEIPPLRDRTEDIAPLVLHFVNACARESGRSPKEFLASTMRALENYPWPGNVRELEHVVERLCVMFEEPVLTPEHLGARFFQVRGPQGPEAPSTIAEVRDRYGELTRDLIVGALNASSSQRKAAQKLGIPYSTFFDLLKKHGLTKKALKAHVGVDGNNERFARGANG